MQTIYMCFVSQHRKNVFCGFGNALTSKEALQMRVRLHLVQPHSIAAQKLRGSCRKYRVVHKCAHNLAGFVAVEELQEANILLSVLSKELFCRCNC